MTSQFARSRMARTLVRRRVLVLLAGASLVSAQPARCAERAAEELQIAFLFNFAKFTEWPSDPAAAGTPFRICVLGDGTENGHDQALTNRVIHGRRVKVVKLELDDDRHRCHVLLLRGLEPLALARALESVRGASVLTVGESDDFLDQGGIIRFVMEGNRLRFEIQLEHAAIAHLKLNASLLALARKTLGARSSS